MTYYKFLQADGLSPYAGYKWPLPSGKRPGKWVSVEGELEACENGIHACRAADMLPWLDAKLYVLEFKGEVIESDNKVYGRKARLVSRVDAWNDRTARLFAADCVEHVAHLWVAPAGCDWKPEDTLSVVRRYAEGDATDAELAAARDAAWAARAAGDAWAAWAARAAGDAWDAREAARATARAAARATARAAAWAAAWEAARAAAWAAADDARAAERRWQLELLHETLGIDVSQ